MSIDRRKALGVIGAGVAASGAAAQHKHAGAAAKQAPVAAPKFFSPQEFAVIDAVSEMIIPTDANSPGARTAGVARHLDFVVANSPQKAQAEWKQNLAAFNALAVEKHGRPFHELDEAQRASLLDAVAANERAPRSAADRFFIQLKRAALHAYYTSETGLLKELGYKGNDALASFPGCTHGEGAHGPKA